MTATIPKIMVAKAATWSMTTSFTAAEAGCRSPKAIVKVVR